MTSLCSPSRVWPRFFLHLAAFMLAAVACATANRAAAAPTGAIEPHYWTKRVFFIPYQINAQNGRSQQLSKVELLLSRDGATNWQTLQSAEPNLRGFSYHAPEDGEYWFAVRTLDARGRAQQPGTLAPQLRIVVDTVRPQLTLTSTVDATGAVVVRYEARDPNLLADSIAIEGQTAGGSWAPAMLQPPDMVHPDRIVGRAIWNPASPSGPANIRATVKDRAGQSAEETIAVELRGPSLSAPPSTTGSFDPFAQTAPTPTNNSGGLPPQLWPPATGVPNTSADTAPFAPPSLAGAGARPGVRTPATLVGDGRILRDDTSPTTPGGATNFGDLFAAPALASLSPTGNAPASDTGGWTQPAGATAGNSAERMVNSRTFDVDYELDAIGPAGIAKVELWGTGDGGQTWRSFGVDPDNRSPIRVTVPGAGNYGFRILVDAASGVGAPPPRSGEPPALVVGVDLQPPVANLEQPSLGDGNLADHLVVRWKAADTNLESHPVGLFYSAHATGPWSTIASGLENTGSYTWRLERHLPSQFYLRLEVRDTAGNVATQQTSTPIVLNRPQPTGRLRGVRPVTGGGVAR